LKKICFLFLVSSEKKRLG